MDLDSDSDSDLEFLAGQVTPQSKNTAAASAPTAHAATSKPELLESALQEQIDALRRETWEKLGENVILRSQLESNVSSHERELGNLINQQSKAKEELHQELERLKKEVEKERIQIQFLQAELRSKAGSTGALRTPSDSGLPIGDSLASGRATAAAVPGSTRQNSAPASPSKRRTPAAALSDGFVLKKQRILPSLDASQRTSQLSTTATKDSSTPDVGANSPFVDLPSLLAVVARHRAPGQKATTLELLFTYKLPTGASVGHKISEFGSATELVDTILELISAKSQEDDCGSLLLALLYALVTRRLPLEEGQKRTLSAVLCAKLMDGLKQLNPLPSFASLMPPFSLSLKDLRLLTCVLYMLDILSSVDWEFGVPHELSRRLLTCSHAPQVVAKAVNLLCLQPNSVTRELAKLINPTATIKPSVELLFSGLVDNVPSLSIAQICGELPRSENTCSLATSMVKLGELRESARHRADALVVTFQSACIQLALALQYDRAPTPISMCSQILAILTGHIDCPFPARSRIIQESVLFFWCPEPAKLRDELNEDELAELEVCLAKLVYTGKEPNETVERGRQLLQALAVGADSDLMFEAFEPLESHHAHSAGRDSPAIVGTRL